MSGIRDKSIKFKSRPLRDVDRISAKHWSRGDKCKEQFLLWAYTTYLDVTGIHEGEPVFRPAVCAWEAWKAAWALKSKQNSRKKS